MLQRSIGEMVQIKTLCCDEIWSVCIDSIMLEHLLINMAVNARDAMFDGGVLTIETECVDISEKESLPDIGISPGSYVTLVVSDTGTGIPDHVQDKIFEPFFTTKDIGKGTGLGLSMVYAFVKESNGAIHVYSEEGKGTSFRIYLPRATDDIVLETAICPPLREAAGGTETILLAEDEEEIRHLTSLILEDAGYTVIEAENGEKALEILIETNGLNIDLLFKDIAMLGDINGVQLAARAQVLNPDIKLLFTTGYAKGFIPDMELAQDYDVIEKPYQPKHLIQNIRDVLDTVKMPLRKA